VEELVGNRGHQDVMLFFSNNSGGDPHLLNSLIEELFTHIVLACQGVLQSKGRDLSRLA
jgi:hypothetical protein